MVQVKPGAVFPPSVTPESGAPALLVSPAGVPPAGLPAEDEAEGADADAAEPSPLPAGIDLVTVDPPVVQAPESTATITSAEIVLNDIGYSFQEVLSRYTDSEDNITLLSIYNYIRTIQFCQVFTSFLPSGG